MNLPSALLRSPSVAPIGVLAWCLSVLLAWAALPACGQGTCDKTAECFSESIPITSAATGAPVCDATAIETLPDGGTVTLTLLRSAQDADGGSAPGDCQYAPSFYPVGISPGESVTVTISAPGFQSTTETITDVRGCPCPFLSLSNITLVPQ